jgi:hypothetical protein
VCLHDGIDGARRDRKAVIMGTDDTTGTGADDGRDPTDWNSRTPVDRPAGTGRDAGSAIRWSWWNLLLALPLLMLITPVYNKIEPRFLGLPLFYWFQFAFVFVGVATVAIVFAATRNHRPSDRDQQGKDA